MSIVRAAPLVCLAQCRVGFRFFEMHFESELIDFVEALTGRESEFQNSHRQSQGFNTSLKRLLVTGFFVYWKHSNREHM